MKAKTESGHAADGHAEHVGHIVPLGVLAGVLGALLLLTFITVAVTWVDLGPLNVWIALVIATVKAILVAMIFMHLWHDRPINGIILSGTLLFVALFIGLALLDAFAYEPNVEELRSADSAAVAQQWQTEQNALKKQEAGD